MKIPFFDYPRLFLDRSDEYMNIFSEVASRGAFIMQDDVDIFEKNLSTFSNSKYAIGVGNATDGLEISWMALNLRQGDEVICCSHTMLATASAIKVAGGIPIPVEIGDDKHEVLAHVSGKMRMHFIKILPGDIVKLEISPYDLTRGRITYRNK